MPKKKAKPQLPRPLDVNEEAFRFVRGVIGEPAEDAPVDHEGARDLRQSGREEGG